MRKLSLSVAVLVAAAPLALSQSQLTGRSDDRAQPGTYPIDEIRAFLAEPGVHDSFVPEAPLGIQMDLAAQIPADNPLTVAKVELGRQLYFDKRLSRDETISCATCHDPAMGWTDSAPVSTGIEGQTGGRSAPTVINRILGKTQFWDGRAASLEEQAVGPIGNPIEMGFSTAEASARLNEIEGYRIQFEAVFGKDGAVEAAAKGPAKHDRIGKAIAAFERTVLSGASKNDYFEQAMPLFDFEPDDDEDPEFVARVDRILAQEEEHRMTLAAERGRELFFGKANCSACHVGSDLTDEEFHNIGIGFDGESPDLGRHDATKDPAHKGAFKTPTVRNIMLTAPYMHDGSMKTLMEVVEHYDKGGNKNEWLSDKIFPLKLTEQEKHDLVSFMEDALTGTITDIEIPRLP